jgi:transposase-like protein
MIHNNQSPRVILVDKIPKIGFKSFQTAEETIAGFEAFYLLRKKQVEITPASSDF